MVPKQILLTFISVVGNFVYFIKLILLRKIKNTAYLRGKDSKEKRAHKRKLFLTYI
jgi:hypothetical protein